MKKKKLIRLLGLGLGDLISSSSGPDEQGFLPNTVVKILLVCPLKAVEFVGWAAESFVISAHVGHLQKLVTYRQKLQPTATATLYFASTTIFFTDFYIVIFLGSPTVRLIGWKKTQRFSEKIATEKNCKRCNAMQTTFDRAHPHPGCDG